VFLYTGVLDLLARHQHRNQAWAVGLAPLLVVPWVMLPVRPLLGFSPFALSLATGLVAFGLIAARLR
jgi:hypothetical protein